MSDVSAQMERRLAANPKMVESARAIVRNHAKEIGRILAEDGDDPVKSLGRLQELVSRAAPRFDDPSDPGIPVRGDGDDPGDPSDPGGLGATQQGLIEDQLGIMMVLTVCIILLW
jgi:hypothetical protein